MQEQIPLVILPVRDPAQRIDDSRGETLPHAFKTPSPRRGCVCSIDDRAHMAQGIELKLMTNIRVCDDTVLVSAPWSVLALQAAIATIVVHDLPTRSRDRRSAHLHELPQSVVLILCGGSRSLSHRTQIAIQVVTKLLRLVLDADAGDRLPQIANGRSRIV